MRCVKTRKKNSIPSRSVPTGCLFSPLSSWKPLEHVRTHTRAHVHCISASSLSTTPPPHSITCLTEGLPGKMAAFQTAHSAQRDNALIGEVCRPRAQQKFRHASDGFSICIPDAILFFASFCRILRLQTKCTSGKHLLALKLVFHPRFRLFFLCCSPCSTLCSP